MTIYYNTFIPKLQKNPAKNAGFFLKIFMP